jgi:RNA polymerase sigma-70 factor (ECF subfamily)
MHRTIETLDLPVPQTPAAQSADEELLLAYRDRGDRRAFEVLVDRYEGELFSYLRHYLGSVEMAEDAFQATFLQVHLKCKQFEPGRKVRPWLYAVATNQAIDAQRRNRRHRMASLDRRAGGDRHEYDAGALSELLGSKEPDPGNSSELVEDGQSVRHAVAQLPKPLRQVVLLVYYQGLKYREAADILSIPVGTVKSRLHAAIGRLNQELNPTHPVAGHG